MAAPRKIFRIEERAFLGLKPQAGDQQPPQLAEIMHELGALRTMLEAAPAAQTAGTRALPLADIERLAAKLRFIRSAITGGELEPKGPDGSRLPAAPATRIADELKAVTEGCEQATEKILVAAEEIDQAANNLSAALKDETEQGLAQDIRERVIAIFEACNYQDLISQRVAKVLTALTRVEQQIARALDELAREAAPPMHGPRLEGDRGHVSQSDVDSLFAGDVLSA